MIANKNKGDMWARPGMTITFRAEIMPGIESENRTFRVKEVLPNGSVTLHDFAGEYSAASFVQLSFQNKTEDKV